MLAESQVPLHQGADTQGSKTTETPAGANQERPRPIRTMVVDDSSWVRKSLGYYLNQCLGLEIVGSAADGTQAVEQVAILHPDLVLMDWRMPGVDGVEATRKIKSRPGAPVVVLMSLDNNLQFQTVAQDSGADLWVGKQELYSKFLPLLQQLFSMKFRGAEPFAGPSVD